MVDVCVVGKDRSAGIFVSAIDMCRRVCACVRACALASVRVRVCVCPNIIGVATASSSIAVQLNRLSCAHHSPS